jgi:hypothetical protein
VTKHTRWWSPERGGFSSSRRDVVKGGAFVLGSLVIPWSRPRDARAATSATFDYYISPTGNDSNPGTQASPWAITSLSPAAQNAYNVANWNKIAGKRVGLLSGTYNVYNLWLSAAWNSPALNIPGGTASAPTVIQSVTPQGAHITANNGGALPGNSGSSVSIIGQGYQYAKGYVVFDGLVISDSNGYGIYVNGGGTSAEGAGGGSFIIRNCEIYNISGDASNNPGCMMQYFSQGNLIQNCKLHDCTGSGASLHNFAAIFSFNCHGNTYEYNTIYNCNSGIYDKNPGNGGHTYRYNYIEALGVSPQSCLEDCSGGSAGDVTSAHHNILVASSGVGWWTGQDQTFPSHQSLLFYNNTCYSSGSSGSLMYWAAGAAVSPPAQVTHYNNIYYATGSPGPYGNVAFLTAGLAASNYNCYQSNGATTACIGTSATAGLATLYTLPLWSTLFGFDGNSFAANPSFSSPGVKLSPAGYTLNSGSPCTGAGRVGGTSSGAVCNLGAWDGTITQIGCNFSSTVSVPNAPAALSVS